MRRLPSLIVLFLAPVVAFAQPEAFQPQQQPVAPDGTRATIDLPASQHIKNVGGSDGAGLCVFTSIQHAAYWQNVRTLDGFREWMRKRPGGGWPEKVDQTFAQFCREKGQSVPPYIQHTGGDPGFLELALQTDRCPCVTYSGLDDFYRDRFGRPAVIAHMVNLAYLDGSRAAIIDNNRPGVWVWMTRKEFLDRWLGNSGGWAVVLLAPPPPPHPEAVKAGPCICGDSCKCKSGDCPAKCPTAKGGHGCDCCKPSCTCEPPGKRDKDCKCYPCGCNKGPPGPVFGQQRWGTGGCGPVGPLSYPLPAPAVAPIVRPAAPSAIYGGEKPPGPPPTPNHEWRKWDDGGGYGWRLKVAPVPVGAAEDNYGVRTGKIHEHPEYSAGGVEITKSHAHALLAANGLADDSDHWHLTCVGDAALAKQFLADVAALPADVRGKLHTQTYAPDHWAVTTFDLPAGVNLRKPSPARTAGDVGTLTPSEYQNGKIAALAGLLSLPGGPTWKPAPVAPVRPKQPDPPAPAPAPAPQPQPDPKQPDPAPDNSPFYAFLAALVAFLFGRASRPQPEPAKG
jgi:hypothetical protein